MTGISQEDADAQCIPLQIHNSNTKSKQHSCISGGVLNAGVGGDRTCNLLWRLTEGGLLDAVQAAGGVQRVLLCIGINDYTGSPKNQMINAQRDTLREVLQVLQSHRATRSAEITLFGIPPREGRSQECTEEYNAFLCQIASESSRIKFQEVWSELSASVNYKLLLDDGVHLTHLACWKWADMLKAELSVATEDPSASDLGFDVGARDAASSEASLDGITAGVRSIQVLASPCWEQQEQQWAHLVVHCKKSDYGVYIGRDCAGSKGVVQQEALWGNPFTRKFSDDKQTRINAYQEWLLSQPQKVAQARAELRGKVLGCWCVPERCHGHTLAAVANSDEPVEQLLTSVRAVPVHPPAVAEGSPRDSLSTCQRANASRGSNKGDAGEVKASNNNTTSRKVLKDEVPKPKPKTRRRGGRVQGSWNNK